MRAIAHADVGERREHAGDLPAQEPDLGTVGGHEGHGARIVRIVRLADHRELRTLRKGACDVLPALEGDADGLRAEAALVGDGRVFVARQDLGSPLEELIGDGADDGARRKLRPILVDKDVAHHELGLGAALPGLVDRIEDDVARAIAGAEPADIGRAEHDRRNGRSAVGRRETQMRAVGAHARTV